MIEYYQNTLFQGSYSSDLQELVFSYILWLFIPNLTSQLIQIVMCLISLGLLSNERLFYMDLRPI